MKNRGFFVLSLLLFGCLVFQPVPKAFGADSLGAMKLVGILTNQLDVNKNQATGGAGALFQTAKENLSESDYKKVSDAIPGIGQLIQAAPEVSESTKRMRDKISGAKEGLGSLATTAKNVNRLAAVKNQFSQLGLDTEMVSQFIPIILNFANTAGGETVMNLLKGVWQ